MMLPTRGIPITKQLSRANQTILLGSIFDANTTESESKRNIISDPAVALVFSCRHWQLKLVSCG